MSATWKPRVTSDDLAFAVECLMRDVQDHDGENATSLERVADWLRGEIAEREERSQARAITKITGVSMGRARAALRASKREARA